MKKAFLGLLVGLMLFAGTSVVGANPVQDSYIEIEATNAAQRWWINGSGTTPFRWAVGVAHTVSINAGANIALTGQRSGNYTHIRVISGGGNAFGTGWVLTSRISTNCNAQGQCAVSIEID